MIVRSSGFIVQPEDLDVYKVAVLLGRLIWQISSNRFVKHDEDHETGAA